MKRVFLLSDHAVQRTSRLRGYSVLLSLSPDSKISALFRCDCWHRRISIDLLCCPQSSAQFDWPSHSRQYLFQSPNCRNRIQIIVVAEMRDANELALHLTLSICDDRAKVVAECFYDVAGIHAVR